MGKAPPFPYGAKPSPLGCEATLNIPGLPSVCRFRRQSCPKSCPIATKLDMNDLLVKPDKITQQLWNAEAEIFDVRLAQAFYFFLVF